MSVTEEQDVLTVALTGRIDSGNAAELEAEIGALLEKGPGRGLVLDLKELEYMSSAGLRVLLRLRKLEPRLRLVNASAEVYEILNLTGFTEMIPVEKAYRTVSIQGCEVIGRGSNGTVYRIDQDTAVKVYHGAHCLADVQRERELARKAFVLGVPTAIPYDVVRVGDGYGSVFELLNARSFSKLIAADPQRMDLYVERYVELMKKIHATHVKPGELPEMKEIALNWVNFLRDYLPAGEGEKLVALVERVPERDTMLHGDCHTNNIVMQNDEVLLIDMETLCVGHPVFELASMYLGFVAFGELDHTITLHSLKLPYETAGMFWKKALAGYLGTRDPDQLRAVEEKAMVLGYARLMRRTLRRNGCDTEQGRASIGLCKAHLTELLGRVDTLSF
ncbi:anti-sigma factor antagonist [Pseudoflavonifractor phocaeensis]|uniref:anti-sigma factor antagonist n=1 Tax=Pseudoflavonifractor phocaeensis TaxID=1870988 RepID=UPI00195737D9|nr:anti-sigma factor antagonist [Pseudoflavonifractor phocaeensis]MBM6885477.1 anti-sigma factor antagonist [Pseudoflavonifractor phocaeensis]